MIFTRYVFIQLVAYAIDLTIFVFTIEVLGFTPVWGNVTGKIISGLFCFFSHRTFTFRAAAGPLRRQATGYAIAAAINIPLSSLLLVTFLAVLDIPHIAAKVLADGLCLCMNYLISRFLIFRNTQPSDAK
jgi:putative flippase GtrA